MIQKEQMEFTTILLEKEDKYILPDDFLQSGMVQHINVADCSAPFPAAYAYGKLQGVYWVWKEIQDSYICLNADNVVPKITQEQLSDLQSGKIGMILPRVYCNNRLQESYRAQYYGFDFRMLLSVLKKEYPDYYRHAKEEVLDSSKLFLLGGIFQKKEFDRICSWMFPVLARCAQFIPKRFSDYQNLFLEHLAPYLFTIYVTYWEKKQPYALTIPVALTIEEKEKTVKRELPEDEFYQKATVQEILFTIEKAMKERKPEEAVHIAEKLPEDRKELENIRLLFAQYERERRYYKTTHLDETNDWKKLLEPPKLIMSPSIRRGKPRLLIFEWNSVGHKVNVKAFESFGFECHTIRVPYDKGKFDEDCLEQLNCHLDLNQFDLAFSLNCIGMVAETCYIHDIPYIAWCYDSPSFTGAHWYLFYPTTHVFLFDSDDARHYTDAGIKQAHYMPLAVNLEYFDGIVCSEADRQKYQADISFIGSLYDTSLPEAMGYLNDYQKGYLNALMDNQMDVYGHSFFPEILSQNFMEWLDHPEFNRILNAEFDKEKAKEDVASAGRLQLILNKQTTNKERLLLLNLLAKYHEVKLYSYKNSEALKGLTFCGTADYYTEMPKIFRCSKINLNATLRSIQHGIPLRCLDIMGCHGLLLTNYQKDFDDHFVDGENVLFYTDAEEALEKANFYLAHEELRAKIEEAGYETVKRYYDYPVKIKEILELAGLEYLMPQRR